MKNLYLSTAAFITFIIISSSMASSSAFALTFALGEWLKNGASITTNESADTEGELLFENVLNGGAILCSGLFEGTVGVNGADSISKVFNLSGTEIKELDESGATGGISCTGVKICENGSEIWPVGLPFKTVLNLDTEETNKFFDLVLNAEYAILCLFLGSSIEELCVAAANTFGEVRNGATDVEAVGSAEPLGACNGNAEDGLISVDTALTSLLVGTLSVSTTEHRLEATFKSEEAGDTVMTVTNTFAFPVEVLRLEAKPKTGAILTLDADNECKAGRILAINETCTFLQEDPVGAEAVVN